MLYMSEDKEALLQHSGIRDGDVPYILCGSAVDGSRSGDCLKHDALTTPHWYEFERSSNLLFVQINQKGDVT